MTFLPTDGLAIEITRPGPPEVLQPTQRPVSPPGGGELLLRVAAAGVNRPDLPQREGRYPPPPGTTDIPGLEVAGTVVALGEGVTGWSEGDEACALVAGGGYAEYCLAPAPQCLPIPRGLTPVQGAALPETFFTVWANVFERGRLANTGSEATALDRRYRRALLDWGVLHLPLACKQGSISAAHTDEDLALTLDIAREALKSL